MMYEAEREQIKPLSLGDGKNMVTQLLLLNITVYILLFFTEIIYGIEGNPPARFHHDVLSHVLLPASLTQLMNNPWTIFTSMFTHNSFWTITSNMIWLACFGTMLQNHAGRERILPLYLLSGLCGVVCYLIGIQLIPSFQGIQSYGTMTGASASIMALAIGATVVAPQYRLLPNLPIPFWVITTIFLIVNIVTHVFTSHDMTIIPALVGGGLTGFFYMQQWKQGKDWGAGFNKLLFRTTHLFHPKEQVKLRVIK